METENIFWVVSLIALMVTANILLQSIIMYVGNKPLGHQTIFDFICKDNLTVAQIVCNIWTSAEIFSRFEQLRSISVYNDYVIFLLCSLIFIGFVVFLVYSSCVCVMRIICLVKMDFIEDKVGESISRIVPLVISLTMSTGACIIVIAKGEMNSGPNYSMLSGQIIATGKHFNQFIYKDEHDKF